MPVGMHLSLVWFMVQKKTVFASVLLIFGTK